MSEMLIYQNENGDIKVDVRFEDAHSTIKCNTVIFVM
jgi:hypothetical protein